MKEKKQNNTALAAKMAAYAAAALSALAVAHPASAAIVYNGPHNISVPANGSRSIDLDGDTNNDFQFSSTYISAAPLWVLKASGLNGAQFISYKGVQNLPSGYSIKSSLGKSIVWASAPTGVAGSSSYGPVGQFTNTPGYMGVRFHTAQCKGTSWNYGWIYIDAEGSGGVPNTSVPQIVDWAYESDCDTAIKAGATTSPAPPPSRPVSVPALDEWGMIALAALLSGTAIRRMTKGQSKA
jgi:hypothetical protein